MANSRRTGGHPLRPVHHSYRDAQALASFLAALNAVSGITVRLTFSADLSRETGSALPAGSWWVMYAHTTSDVITVRVNLAADALGRDKFELRLPKAKP